MTEGIMLQISSRMIPAIIGLLALVSLGLIAFVLVGSKFGKSDTLSIGAAVFIAVLVSYLKGFVERAVEKKQ